MTQKPPAMYTIVREDAITSTLHPKASSRLAKLLVPVMLYKALVLVMLCKF